MALSVSISTTSFSACTRTAMPELTSAFSVASATMTAISCLSTSTTDAHSSSFLTPFTRRLLAASFSSRFCASSCV